MPLTAPWVVEILSWRQRKRAVMPQARGRQSKMTQGNGSSHPAKKEFTPRLIFWEVTKGCNLRCIHCRATATELMSPNDLPTEKALDIISQICRLRKSYPRAQRRRAAVSSRHLPARRIRHQPRPARRAGDQRHAGHERRRRRRSSKPASSASPSRSMAPMPLPMTPSAAFRARSTPPFTA